MTTEEIIQPSQSLAIVLVIALSIIPIMPSMVSADSPVLPCYFYGTETDGYLGKATAFATWWFPPNIPLVVRDDYLGIALAGYEPGTRVELTIVDLPDWAWEELREELIGRKVIAVVTDRPGSPAYADTWPATFWALSGGRMWVGKLLIQVQALHENAEKGGFVE